MYGSQSDHTFVSYIFSDFSNVYYSAYISPTALKLGRIINFDMLFLVMKLISLVDEKQFMSTLKSIASLYRVPLSRPWL